MESIFFEGKDDADVERQIWDWQSANRIRIIKKHPLEKLPISAKKVDPGYPKIVAANAVSIRIDYEDIDR